MQILRVFQGISRLLGRGFHSKASLFAFISFALLVLAFAYQARVHGATGDGTGSAGSKPSSHYQIAVYYWPNYHVDPRNEAKLGKGWTEWELVKAGKVKFPGQDQPHVPLWGYRDESDPKQMARSIDAMADHGITAILFDWYRYNDGSFLDDCLRKGFLKAPNRNRVKFALMWANHILIFSPAKATTPLSGMPAPSPVRLSTV